MKKIIFMFSFLSLLFFMVGCENDSNVPASETTYLPKLDMSGDQSVFLDCSATSFDDPGVVATEQGNPVDLNVSAVGRYFGGTEVNSPDIYEISYSAFNKDSIPGATQRIVYFPPCNGDLVSSLEGVYLVSVVRNGTTEAKYQNNKYTFITSLGNDVYQLSDAIGGYYDFGRGYGWHYAGTGMTVKANDIAANDFTHTDVIGVGAFGGELNMTAFAVDAATKTITFTTEWSYGYTFEVTLTQTSL